MCRGVPSKPLLELPPALDLDIICITESEWCTVCIGFHYGAETRVGPFGKLTLATARDAPATPRRALGLTTRLAVPGLN